MAGKRFYCKFIAKTVFPIEFFIYVTIADADTGNQKSLHTLLDKYLDHYMLVIFEENRVVRTKQILNLLTKIGDSKQLFDAKPIT